MDPENNRSYAFGPYVLDEKERLLRRSDLAVSLPPKAFDTLLLLVKNRGHIVGKEEMIKALWPDAIVEENNLSHYISLLRRELGDNPSDQQYIETVPKHGYRFVAEVHMSGPGSQAEVSTLTAQPDRSLPALARVKTVPPWWRLPTPALLAGIMLVSAVVVAYFSILKAGHRDPALPGQKFETLAILPFKTLDPDTSEEYLSYGIADALITKFSSVKNVIVRPLSAVRNYSKPGIDPSAIGKELRVDALLDGSVHRVGDSLRVTAQLVSVNDGKVLWTEKFERPISELQALGEVISSRVTTVLDMALDEEDRSIFVKRYTENGEAYEAYMKGRFFMDKRTEQGVRKGLAYFEEALEQDPNYAPAYVGEIDYYMVSADWILSREEAHRKAELAASKALAIDDRLAEAHALMGFLKVANWEWAAGEAELKRALELNPRSSQAHVYYSNYLGVIGRIGEAFEEMKRAQQLNPLSALNSARLAALYSFQGRYNESIDLCRKALELDPEFTICHDVLGWVYLKTGKPAESVAEYEKAVAISNKEFYPYGELGYAYAVTGRREDAIKLIARLNSRKTPSASNYPAAMIYAGLGDKDEAFRCLNNAVTYHDDFVLLLNVDPQLESLRSDPRFIKLLHRVGLSTT